MAMILYQRGLLDLEAPIAAVVPEFAATGADSRRREVTVRHVVGTLLRPARIRKAISESEDQGRTARCRFHYPARGRSRHPG